MSPPKTVFLCLLVVAALGQNPPIIAVDIGHLPDQLGALSARGVPEYNFNRSLAAQLLSAIQEIGYPQSFIINKDGDSLGLSDRTRIAKERGAQVFLSVHHDSVQPKHLSVWTFGGQEQRYCDKFQGYSLFLSLENPWAEKNLRLGKSLGHRLVSEGFSPTLHHAEKIPGENRTLVDSGLGLYEFPELAVLRTAEMPALLIECGVIVHREEELKLASAEQQKAMARAIALGLHHYLRYSESK